MPVININEDQEFANAVQNAGPKLISCMMSAPWCAACTSFMDTYETLSETYGNAVFLKVDVEKCEGVAAKYRIDAMPTFVLIKDKKKMALFQGANKSEFVRQVNMYYKETDSIATGSGVKGMMDLDTLLAKQSCECLNQSDDHPYEHCLTEGGGYLESDCDEQLILSLTFNQAVKVHSLRVKAPSGKGPKTVRIFMNQPTTLDFDKADSMVAVQDLSLTPEQLDGSPIALKFVKFQNVNNLQFFFKDNQGNEDVTQIDYFGVIGSPIGTTNMNDFKRVAGKKGEGHFG